MVPHKHLIPRLLSSKRPLRPASSTRQRSRRRLFTQNSQLLLISHSPCRPQLPFLYPSSGLPAPQTQFQGPFQYQISRLLTTERKRYFKNELKTAAKYTIYGWTLFGLFSIFMFGVNGELNERRYPTPPEWTTITRFNYLSARAVENPNENETGLVDWVDVGQRYMILLLRLENLAKDGAGIEPILGDEGDILIKGVGKSGRDVSAKSEPWREGYHAVLMGAARAAEHLDGWVSDTTRNVCFPPEVVIGPSNPHPKPVPFGATSPPLEENCVPAFPSPQIFYTKLLTTRGFSTKQRLDAALAYADWLDFKGLPSSAEEAYDWGLDIALGALPVGVNNVVDIKTGVINDSADYISLNVLLATTHLAIHHAQNNNLATALPIFLSILRARRNLPPPIKSSPARLNSRQPYSILSAIKSMITHPPYPIPSSTGDENQTRTPTAICEEAAIMAHIGEVLFASSLATEKATSSSRSKTAQTRRSGLSWTRDSVDLAESILLTAPHHDREARQKCAQCLGVGMENWSKMVGRMQRVESAEPDGRTAQNHTPWAFLWSKPFSREEVDEQQGGGKWVREAEMVEQRLATVKRIMREEGVSNEPEVRKGGVWGLLYG